MSGYRVWVGKELLEIRRTWRRFVLPGMLLVMAILSPVLARITPALLRSVASSDPGVVIQLPEPVAADAVREWAQSLSQLVLVAVIVIAAGLVSGDLKDGAAQLALVKPLRRRDFVLAKVTVLAGFLMVVTLVAAAACAAVTRLIFGDVPIGNLLQVTLVWLIYAVMTICVMTLLSTVVPSQIAAAGIGIGIYFLVSIAGIWTPANRFSPVGLLSALDKLAIGAPVPLTLPIVSAILVAAVSLFVALVQFRRRPLQ